MPLPIEDIKADLDALLPGVTITVEGSALRIEPKDVAAVCRALKETERFRFDYVANLTAVDYPPTHLDVVYHLYSMGQRCGPVTLKVKLPREQPVVASVTPIWRGAEFQEREVYDLFGVRFEGHPDLRRILMWDEFEGHPMRKDYVVEDQNVLERPPS